MQGARSVTIEYGASAYPTAVVDALGHRHELTVDALGRITQQIRPDGSVVHASYTPQSHWSTVTPPGRASHAFAYDPGALLASYEPPALAGVSQVATLYEHDVFAQLLSVDYPSGAVAQYGYDSATGRLTALTLPEDAVAIGYAPLLGRPDWLSASAVDLELQHDGPLLTAQLLSGDVNGSVGFTYDTTFAIAAENVATAPGDPVVFQRDGDGHLTTAGAEIIARDATTGFVSGTTLGALSDAWSYNGHGELSAYTAEHSGTVLYARAETRDLLGRVIERIETIEGQTHHDEYSFDAVGRLTQVRRDGIVVEEYGYDANDNRITSDVDGEARSATYDAQDRLVQLGTDTYDFDANGSLRSVTRGPDVTSYHYDAMGRLRSVELADGRRIDYVIDALGRRVGKKVGGSLQRGFLYRDELNVVAELGSDGESITSRFVYGTRQHVPDYMMRDGIVYRFVTDAVGSVRLVVNANTGAVAQRLDYDSFGRMLTDTNPGFQPFGFAGGLYDPDTQLVRFGARDYDPEIGRWTAKDPILFAGRQANLYVYVGNDPVNRIDPRGLLGVAIGVSGGAGYGLGIDLNLGIGFEYSNGNLTIFNYYGGSATIGAGGYAGVGGDITFIFSNIERFSGGAVAARGEFGGVSISADHGGSLTLGGGPGGGLFVGSGLSDTGVSGFQIQKLFDPCNRDVVPFNRSPRWLP